MSAYNKLIAAVVGNVVGLVLAWLATQWPAIAECSAATEVCTVLGLSQTQITAALMMIINAVMVHQWAANK